MRIYTDAAANVSRKLLIVTVLILTEIKDAGSNINITNPRIN